MANAYFYSNTAIQTTLTGSISAGATTLSVGAVTGFPGSFPYVLALDYGSASEELVTVTAAAGLNLTVTRAFGGTSAQSHSLGAVVRHVYNSVDATDFRTHEAATAAIHGVTGALVGTSDTQTLTNKTLNGAALSGTLSGTPTFSGNLTFTGEVAHSNLYRGSRGTAIDGTSEARVTGDANARWILRADGQQVWGPGTAGVDTNLYRSGISELKTDSAFVVTGELKPANLVRGTRGATSDSQYETRVTGDANARWFMQADGRMFWGPGSGAVDTVLYRNAADELKTDDSFTVGGNLNVTGTADAATAATTTGVTGATGWDPTIQALRVTSGVSTVNITLNRTGATLNTDDLGGTSGNISPDMEVCTIPAAFRPPADLYVLASTGIGHGSIRIQTDGSCQLLTWIPNIGITSGSNLRFTYTFSS